MCVTSVYKNIKYNGTTTSQVITIRDNLMSMISRGDPKLGYGVIALSMYCSTLLKQKQCAAASSSSNQPLSRSKEIYQEYMSLFINLKHEINTGSSLGAAASDEDVETGENDL
jgi:hypothetical protein